MKSSNRLGWVGNQLGSKLKLPWIVVTSLITVTLLISTVGCLGDKTEIQYSSLVKSKELLNGSMKIAQNKVRVSIEGTDKVSEFSPAAGYYMVHRDDLEFMVENTYILNELQKDDQLRIKIKEIRKQALEKFK